MPSHREHRRNHEREVRAMRRAGLIVDDKTRAKRQADRVLPERNEHGCRKVAYRSETAAQRALVTLQKSDRSKTPTRAYECPRCSLWHLTSQERR